MLVLLALDLSLVLSIRALGVSVLNIIHIMAYDWLSDFYPFGCRARVGYLFKVVYSHCIVSVLKSSIVLFANRFS